jgi:hypothetical protein
MPKSPRRLRVSGADSSPRLGFVRLTASVALAVGVLYYNQHSDLLNGYQEVPGFVHRARTSTVSMRLRSQARGTRRTTMAQVGFVAARCRGGQSVATTPPGMQSTRIPLRVATSRPPARALTRFILSISLWMVVVPDAISRDEVGQQSWCSHSTRLRGVGRPVARDTR